MIIRDGVDLFGQVGTDCAHCGKNILTFPFISWDFLDNDSIARVAFHSECAQGLVLRMSRDLYEIDAGH